MADLLILAPHPDDAEIHCGGTIAAHVRQGASVVVVDATRGELASRGTPEERSREAAAAAQVLGLTARENLGLRDGYLSAGDTAARDTVIECLRRHRPAVVIALSAHARHPDHAALAGLVQAALKGAELHGLRTASPAHRGMRLWWCEAEVRGEPDLLVPLTAADWSRKLEAVRCYGSQLHRPDGVGPVTGISSPDFTAWIEARGRAWGREAGSPYAEGFLRAWDLPRIADLRTA
jgi:bacillithiol biosynthesis deacetylase BshB1